MDKVHQKDLCRALLVPFMITGRENHKLALWVVVVASMKNDSSGVCHRAWLTESVTKYIQCRVVETACNGCEAFTLLKNARKQNRRFDAILTDEKMPHVSHSFLLLFFHSFLACSERLYKIPIFTGVVNERAVAVNYLTVLPACIDRSLCTPAYTSIASWFMMPIKSVIVFVRIHLRIDGILGSVHIEQCIAQYRQILRCFFASYDWDSLDYIRRIVNYLLLQMTGTGLAKLLTSSPEWRRIPVFLMSSVVTEAMRQEALHTGIVKVFTKPITSDTLQGVWKNVQRRRHFRHQKPSNTGENYLKLEKLKSPSMKRDQNAEQILPSAKRPRTIALSSPCSEQVDASETDVSLFTKVSVYPWRIFHLSLILWPMCLALNIVWKSCSRESFGLIMN